MKQNRNVLVCQGYVMMINKGPLFGKLFQYLEPNKQNKANNSKV